MGDVTQFPNGRRPPLPPLYGDPWEPQARAADERYALAVLERMLPAVARRHVAGLDLRLIASAILCDVDVARHERRLDPDYDRRRAGGEALALAEMFGGSPTPPLPAQAEPPPPGEPEAPPWANSREAAALAELFSPRSPEPEGAA